MLEELREKIGSFRALSHQEVQVFVLGVLAHLRINGGVYCSELEGYIKENGNAGVFINQPHLPNFAPNARVPVFLASKKTKGLETLYQGNRITPNWYQSWLVKCMLAKEERELMGDVSADIYLLLIKALHKAGVILDFVSNTGEQVWGINPEILQLSVQVAHLRCDHCKHTHTVAVSEMGS